MNVTDSASDASDPLRSTWKHRPFAAHWVGDWQVTSQSLLWWCSIPKDVISHVLTHVTARQVWLGLGGLQRSTALAGVYWSSDRRPVSKIINAVAVIDFSDFSWVLDIFDVVHLPFMYHSFTLPGYEKRSDGFHCAAGYVGAVEVSRMSSFGKPWCVFSIVQWHPYCLGSPNSCWCQWSICWVNSHVTWRLKTNVWGIFEGSLEVKLPTIWTDEKQSRAEAERRERLEERRSEKRKSQKK